MAPLSYGSIVVFSIVGAMDAKNVIYGETGLEKLVQMLRASGQPQDIAKLVERYLEILRELVLPEEKR